jgi:hypothetical protein
MLILLSFPVDLIDAMYDIKDEIHTISTKLGDRKSPFVVGFVQNFIKTQTDWLLLSNIVLDRSNLHN